MKEIKINRKTGKAKAFVFSLCDCSIKNLTYWFLGLAFGQQFLSMSIEIAIWGESFPHAFDAIFLSVISCAYFYFSYELGDFLLDVIKRGELSEVNDELQKESD